MNCELYTIFEYTMESKLKWLVKVVYLTPSFSYYFISRWPAANLIENRHVIKLLFHSKQVNFLCSDDCTIELVGGQMGKECVIDRKIYFQHLTRSVHCVKIIAPYNFQMASCERNVSSIVKVILSGSIHCIQMIATLRHTCFSRHVSRLDFRALG